MSIARFGRALWRGFTKTLQPTAKSAGSLNGAKSEISATHKQLVARVHTVTRNDFAAQARRQALKQFIKCNGRRIGLYSFVGFHMIDADKDRNVQPDLAFLFQAFQGGFQTAVKDVDEEIEYPSKISEYDIVERLGKPSSFGAVYHAKKDEKEVAVKMLFNVNTAPDSSSSAVILQSFKREYDVLKSVDRETSSPLPKHPNIINILNVFVDNTTEMPDSLESYPFMLPRSINNDGLGRSKTMFLVMPKYSYSLQSFLEENKNLSFDIRFHLLCQLFEAVAHLESYKIAHRDLKADNLLIDTSNTYPQLIIADFGSCFNGNKTDMDLSYQSEYVDKGGNPALMAPEILYKEPGRNVVLNYCKADVWAAGSIAFELFGRQNPLYSTLTNKHENIGSLQSGNQIVDLVVKNVMHVDTHERLSACDASNILCLLLYNCPLTWFLPGYNLNKEELQVWLLEMSYMTHRSEVLDVDQKQYNLFQVFASRVTIEDIFDSFEQFSILQRKE